MGIQKVVVIQVVSTFLILSSSCFATQEMEYKGGPSPSSIDSELDVNFIRAACKRTFNEELCYESLSPYAYDVHQNLQNLCSHANWLAIQGVGNVSRALTYLKGQPVGLLPYPMADKIDVCNSYLASAKLFIQQALKEGPDDYGYERLNRYDLAIGSIQYCAFSDPIAHELRVANDVAVMLISNVRELCS